MGTDKPACGHFFVSTPTLNSVFPQLFNCLIIVYRYFNRRFSLTEKKKLIGLTGAYCAGKNLACALLEKRGLPVLDVDTLGHEALEIKKEAVFDRFGQDLKNADGTVNRWLLGRKVFGNPSELAALEAIVHPVVNRLTEDWVKQQNGSCAVNAALLHKSSVFTRLDFIILIEAPFITRLLRARRRDKLPWRVLLRRFASQKDFYPQYLSAKADIYKVENSGFYNNKLESRIIQILLGEGL